MALTNLSQITTSGISTLADINLNNITGVAATFTGNVTVGGTLTYDDVTNIDSVGLVTARSGVNITGGDLTLPDAIIHSGDTNTKIRFPAADTFTVETNGAEALRVNSSAELLVGTTTSDLVAGYRTSLQIADTGDGSGVSIFRYTNNVHPATLNFGKSRSGTLNANTLVSSGDSLGMIQFGGADGSSFRSAASITGVVDGTPGSGDMPGRLVFATTNDGASSATERLRITSDGNINITGGNLQIGGTNILNSGRVLYNVEQIKLADTKELVLGSSDDLKIYHSGSHSFISEVGSGALKIKGDDIRFEDAGGTEALRIDSGGRVLQGLTSAKFGFFNDNNAPPVHQIQGDTYYNTAFSIFRDGAGGSGPNFILAKGRGAIVQDNDDLGNISFQGHDGTTELIEGAKIFAEVGGTPGSNDMPTDLVFNTNSGTSTSSERLRITAAGLVGIGIDNPDTKLTVKAGSGDQLRLDNAGERYTQISLRNNGTQKAALWLDETTDQFDLFATSGYAIRLLAGGTERLRIASDGQIGMGKAGTVTPNGNSPLTIQESDSNSETICLRATNSGGNGSQPGIVMKTAAGGHIGGIYCDVNSDYMRLSTSGTDRVIITNGGSVGIGDNDPSDALTVYRSNVGNPTGITIRNTETSSTYSHARLRLESQNGAAYAHLWADVANTALRLGYNSSSTVNIYDNGKLTSPNQIVAGTTFGIANVSGSISGSGGGQDYIGLRHGTTFGLMLKTAGTNVGNIGIGHVSPEAKLHVEENLSHSSTYYLNVDAHILVDNPGSGKSVLKLEGEAALVYGGGANKFFIADRQNERIRINEYGNTIFQGPVNTSNGLTGNAGVLIRGKTVSGSSTTVDLNVSQANSSNGIGLEINESSNNANALATLVFNHGSLKSMIACSRVATNNWGTDLRFYTHDTSTDSSNQHKVYERMRISSNGYVGMNVTSPSDRLHVKGAIVQQGAASGVRSIVMTATFGAGTHNIFTCTATGVDNSAVATMEYVSLYAYAGTSHYAGIKLASTRRGNSNTTWINLPNVNVAGSGNDSNIQPNLFFQNGVLMVTIPSSTQVTATVRITVRGFTLARNYSAG